MDEEIKRDLQREEQTEFHKKMLQHCKTLVRSSRDNMSQFYEKWDQYHDVYRSYMYTDKDDKKAGERGEPVKMVIPTAYAQAHTFVAFLYMLFTLRPTYFELVGIGDEDMHPAKLNEMLLTRDLTYSSHNTRLYQQLLDVAKYGIAVKKETWVEEKQVVKQVVQGAKVFGMQITSNKVTEVEKIKYQGNKIVNVSPYRFFPDTRLPLVRFQEGEFCASEDEYSMTQLYSMEADGMVAGVGNIKSLTKKDLEAERPGTRAVFTQFKESMGMAAGEVTSAVMVTEVIVSIIPSDFTLASGRKLGEGSRPEKWLVWYANDNRVIRCEPFGYAHNKYPYSISLFNPDIHEIVSPGLCASIEGLQSVITWLINSHITSVRKVINDRLIVDPAGIEMNDLRDRNPVIRMKSSVAKQGVDKFIKQLGVSDVTAAYMNDAAQLEKFIQIVTGINENTLGQFSPGRRSAREAAAVSASSAFRLKLIGSLIFDNSERPMAERMVSNLSEGLTEETLLRVAGSYIQTFPEASAVRVTKDQLVGAYDFQTLDLILPSEKDARAGQLQELLTALLANPQAAAAFQMDPQKLLMEILQLRGINDINNFKLPPPPPGMLPPPAQVLPDDQIAQMAQSGQISPMEQMMS